MTEPSSPPRPKTIRKIVAAGGFIAIVGVSLVGIRHFLSVRRQPAVPAPAESRTKDSLSFTQKQGYVGSQICGECHGDIVADYTSTHSMSQSMSQAGKEKVIEDYQHLSFSIKDRRAYQISRTSPGLTHAEQLVDAHGEVVDQQIETIAYILGSGRRGRAYLVDRGGQLFQSPISWYSQQQRWDLSPGYPPEGHLRFDRKIQSACVFCHSGLPQIQDYSNEQFAQPAFAEFGIGCERCHGPGKEHVLKQTALGVAGRDATIVNPGRLPAHERDSVCFQCHLRSEFLLPRSQRRFEDFRPGQAYEDVFLGFVDKEDANPNSMPLVQQFRSSQCYRKSNGEMGCISCHDPHSRPSPDHLVDYYRTRCMKCHADRGCRLALEKQNEAPANGSCVHCHLPPLPAKGIPHTALTDHRILRRPNGVTGVQPVAAARAFDLFRDDTRPLPPPEVDRAWGLVFASIAARTSDRELATRAVTLLRRREPGETGDGFQQIDDTLVLERLGVSYMILGQPELAKSAWIRAGELEPNNESTLHSMAFFAVTVGDTATGMTFVDRLLQANPNMAEYHWLRAKLNELKGDLPQAIQDAENALVRDPTAISVRQWLVAAYSRVNREADANKQRELIRRLSAQQ